MKLYSEDEQVEILQKCGVKLRRREREYYRKRNYFKEYASYTGKSGHKRFQDWANEVNDARDAHNPSADEEEGDKSSRSPKSSGFPTSEQATEVTSLPSATYQTYQEVLSHVIALEAAKDPEVQDFRSQVLGNRLLMSVEEVEQWILQQWEALGIARALPHLEPGAVLTYTTPDNRARSLWTRPPGVLFQLSELTLRLQWRYHWKQSEATSFILVPGFCPTVAILWSIVHWTLPNTSPRAMWRIELLIDPILPPEEVAAAYRDIRKSVIPRKRVDPLSEKILHLAEFVATHPKGKGLEERMKEWNEWSEQRKETDPEWEYKPYASKFNFSTECGQAFQRLLNPDYQFPGQQDATPNRIDNK